MRITGVHQLALPVEDLDRAVAFYRERLGLPLLARYDPPGMAFIDLGGVRLLLQPEAPAGLVYLAVDDLAATVEELRGAGVPIEQEPHVIHVDSYGHFGPPGIAEELAFVRDSEGNPLGLFGRREPADGSTTG